MKIQDKYSFDSRRGTRLFAMRLFQFPVSIEEEKKTARQSIFTMRVDILRSRCENNLFVEIHYVYHIISTHYCTHVFLISVFIAFLYIYSSTTSFISNASHAFLFTNSVFALPCTHPIFSGLGFPVFPNQTYPNIMNEHK